MPIYYEAKALERAIDTAPRITPSTKSVLKKIIRSAPVADSEPVVHGSWVSFHSQAAGHILSDIVLNAERGWMHRVISQNSKMLNAVEE